LLSGPGRKFVRGSRGELLGTPLTLMQAPVELLPRELPANRPGLAAVLGLEGEDARRELLQAVGDDRKP